MSAQTKRKAGESEQVSPESSHAGQAELFTEAFTGAVSLEDLTRAQKRVDAVRPLDASFTPTLDAAWTELEASGSAVDEFDSEGLVKHGMGLFKKVVEAEEATTMPSLTDLEKGVMGQDDFEALDDSFEEHATEFEGLLEAQPEHLPAWSADLGEDDEDDGPAGTLCRVVATLADVIIAERVIELCGTIRGDNEAGQQALSMLIQGFHGAPGALRPYLMEAIEAQELGELHIHNFLLGVEQADLLVDMDAKDALLAKDVDGFEVDQSGTGFARGLGHVLDALGGRARTEFEAEGSFDVPVVGPLSLVGGVKVTVSRGADDLKATLHMETGLKVGKGDEAGAALEAGYTLEATGRTGVQVAQLLQLGLLDSLASCKEEPPPFLFDWVLGASVGTAIPGLSGFDAGYRAVSMFQGRPRKSLIWSMLADAFVAPKERRRLIEAMEEGDYVESFDQIMLKGEVSADGAAAKGSAKSGIVRRIEKKKGRLRTNHWIGIKLNGEVALGDGTGVTAKFEMKDVIDRKGGKPPESSAQIKLALEGSVTSGTLDGMDTMFGTVGLEGLQAAFAKADRQDEYKEQVDGMKTVLSHGSALTERGLTAGGYRKIPGLKLGLEVEAAFAPRTGKWTLTAALVSKLEVETAKSEKGGAKGVLQRKEVLGEIEL